MVMNAIWKVKGAGPRETGEGLGVKAPEGSKCKRLLRSVVAATCLVLTCFLVGDLPAASAGCRKVRTRRYVVERPVVVRKRCVRYRPVKTRSCYVPYRRRIVRGYTYYTPRYKVVRRRPAYVTVWEEDAPCSKRLVYRRSNCDKRVVYVAPDCDEVSYVEERDVDCDGDVEYIITR